MATVRRKIVCLANSRKTGGRCVAGKRLLNRRGNWIRPVSDRQHQEVSFSERRYPNGDDPQVLDVILLPLVEARPHNFQQENWLLDTKKTWDKEGRLTWDEVFDLRDSPDALWLDGHDGSNQSIPLDEANKYTASLYLIHVDSITLQVIAEPTKKRVQGRFQYRGLAYRLWVTDPAYETPFKAKADGDYRLGESLLTISLGEPFEGFCYKLIAAIIERKP